MAESAERAIELLEAEKIDIVLADVILPRTTGVELLVAVRESHPQVQVILMTGEPTETHSDTSVNAPPDVLVVDSADSIRSR